MAITDGWFADRAPKVHGVGSGYVAPFAPAAVAFDGSTMLYALPTTARTTTWSLSCFVNFGTPGGGVTPDETIGAFYRSNTLNDGTYRFIQFTPNMSDATPHGAGVRVDDAAAIGSDYTAFPNAWAHLTASCRLTANVSDDTITVDRIIYIDDTEILNDSYDIDLFGAPEEEATFGFDITDTTDGDGLHAHNIGGKFLTVLGGTSDNDDPTPSSNGLKCGMAEYVVYADRFVDWSSSPNRLKFHRVSGGLYLPKQIGVDGSTPFGTAPLIYLSGNAGAFVTNHGSGGGTLSVAGSLISIAGPS